MTAFLLSRLFYITDRVIAFYALTLIAQILGGTL